MMKRAVILSCLLLAFAAGIPGVRAAAPVVRATLKPDTVLIGDRFSIEVLIDKDMMQVVELPTFGTDMTGGGSIEILSESPLDTLRQEGRRQVLRKRYELTSFDAGIYELGRYPVLYGDKNITDTLYSQAPLRIVVDTFPVDTQKSTVYDIKGPEQAPLMVGEFAGYAAAILVFAAVLAVQLVVARCAWYKMGWDIANVYTTAEELARGQALTDPDYFRLCPNNAPLTILQAVPMWVAVKLGLAVPFVVLPYLDAVLLNLTAYFTVRCAQRITPSRWARGFAAAVSILWIALSPYVLYPYTDTWAVLFPVLAIYAWMTVRRPALRWGLVSLACFAGAAVKPTVLIVLIALGLLGLCRFLGRRDFSAAAWKRALAVLAALVLGAVPGQVFQRASTAYLAGSAVPQEQLSETHYLMMGMNGETYGGHSPDDVAFSQSFASLADRQRANLQRAWERVCEKGLWGNVRFFTIKLYKAYADGSFAANSSFLDLEIPRRTDTLSTFVRSLYHHRGSLNPLCHTLAQGLWLAVLALCAVAAFARRRPEAQALTLAILGATAYLLLFEVWPRYLFVFAPLYVLLATMALDRPLFARTGEKRQKA